jgi:hypothetical protein
MKTMIKRRGKRESEGPEEVVVEEVQVEAGLHEPAGIDHPVVLVESLVVGSVDPVHDIQGAVDAEQKDVVPRQVLHLPVSLKDDELGDDCERLQVDGKGPEQLLFIVYCLMLMLKQN